jgi:hypothetical protein
VRFITFAEAAQRFAGRTVAIVGSAPSCAANAPGFVDSHEVVVRINNYKLGNGQGFRTDAFFSFFGNSIRKSREDLQRDGVTLCMAKCPNSRPIESKWHEERGKLHGIDYRYIYEARRAWWFCDTFVPDDAHFLRGFDLLGRHQPTTGFAAVLDVLAARPRSVYLTGFDFFRSGVHNVDEKWRAGDPGDPICHRPDLEAVWIAEAAKREPLRFDRTLEKLMETA